MLRFVCVVCLEDVFFVLWCLVGFFVSFFVGVAFSFGGFLQCLFVLRRCWSFLLFLYVSWLAHGYVGMVRVEQRDLGQAGQSRSEAPLPG